jgi:hypothetical protein
MINGCKIYWGHGILTLKSIGAAGLYKTAEMSEDTAIQISGTEQDAKTRPVPVKAPIQTTYNPSEPLSSPNALAAVALQSFT